VANGWVRASCWFVQGESATPQAAARLELVATEGDGFRIADLDLGQRGVGAALGESADIPRFSWADPFHDRDTLTRARQEAFKLLAADPGLRRRQNRPLLNLVRARFGEDPFTQDGAPPPPPNPDAGNRRRRRRRR
jgi:ATP-dependent DNA helicase RecG